MAHSWEKKKKPALKWRFAKATAYGALFFGAYQYYTPEAAKEAVKDKISEWTGLQQRVTDVKDIEFSFHGEENPELMGEQTVGTLTDNTNVPDNWFAVEGRHSMLMKNGKNARSFNAWVGQMRDLRGKSIAEKAKGVDALVDREITYTGDQELYGRREYWASPAETLQAQRGDCEDYAILKYHALRALGVPADRMFVVAVGDKNSQKLDHATLMVNVREPGFLRSAWEGVARLFISEIKTDYMILDNDQSPLGKLVEERDAGYKPYYAMNENGFWAVPANSKLRW